MRKELFKVAELVPLLVLYSVYLVLVFLGLDILFIVSFQEWINSLDVALIKELWEVQHHHFLILNTVQFEYVVQH
mgnify:CR=1 FL=1